MQYQADEFINMKVNDIKNWKPLLTTYEVMRITPKTWEINCFSDGWVTTLVKEDKLRKLINGEIKPSHLNWK